MSDDEFPVLASRDEVHIIQYNHKIWACCSDCRSTGEGDYEFREVEDPVEKWVWACSNCQRRITRFVESEEFELNGSETQAQIWVASWLVVPVPEVQVSIDG